jgi:GntR family transcriptional regulator/MocR family aminotransferase
MSKRRTTFGRQPKLLLTLIRGGGALHQQIERGLREAVRSGRLRRGAALPSTRSLAHDLGVSRGVIVEAYAQLVAEGFLSSRQGSRTVVAADPPAVQEEPRAIRETPPRFDFRPGRPDLRLFPRGAFLRAARHALRSLRPAHLTYGDPQGAPELRAPLSDYVGRVRHVVANEQDIVVCSGIAQGLGIISRALVQRGVRRIAIEDPSHPGLRQIVRQAGLEPVAVPVDARGLRVDRLARLHVRAVVVTPAHQFPTGAVLAPERRQELHAWAVERDALIIEDDYDAEYRYDRQGVGALQGLNPDHIVYAGSASKILAPALRLGWVVVPRAWRDLVREIKRIADLGSPTLDQLIYAEFLQSGELDRHLRRMRIMYRKRRDALLSAMARQLPDWEPRGVAAGLHVVAGLPPRLSEQDAVRAAARASVRVYPLGEYRLRHSPGDSQGLVLGYAGLSESRLRDAVERLAEVMRRRHSGRVSAWSEGLPWLR